MLDTRHCRAAIIKSEACTPAAAAAFVRQFVQQEVEIAPDVHRNLNLAIAALEDLERHRISNAAATAQVQSKAALHKATPKPAQMSTATPAHARLPAPDLAAAGSTHTKMAKSDKSGKKSKKQKSET